MNTPGKLSHASLEQAAQWYVRLQDQGGALEQLRWQAWVAQNPEHLEAWQYVQRVSQRFAPLQEQAHGASRALRSSRRQTLKTLLVLCAGSTLAWGAWRNTALPRRVGGWSADYATTSGETRDTLLADGSHVWLNALSALDVRFDVAQRLLHLRFGEVLIDTAKDANRPFLVETEHGRMQALGTRFSVLQGNDHTQLNVFEGRVQVTTQDQHVRILEAGQQVSFTRDGFTPTASASPAREAWSRGVLLADNLPLGQLIAELNRYRPGHLGCDPAVAHLPVMGSFPLMDSDHALHLLQAALPVRVDRLMPWWATVRPK
ncbi:FecR domain-containing protein [Pseudomonas fluorescens group sp.]|uniref:Iron(III) dicitrate sensor protein n=2 Tax=Pseudomonas fluorescens TaxID=294 RepID=C3JXK4_PSEFS|nr:MULTISPECIES: FecR domain-containing protein [Pseudomonas fluorescens group]MBZ6456448.1 FecR domain-containing protein [Pseudomonas fluorescens group sp.]MBZ6460634.1 FecR domain-containing protein [Pseudomonas fluorescens group sp.]MBZ6466276.1 FecR domain-containing protein [Pseudomonas fluorescens group sp.]WQD69984.1 FecR domain-containing protein [Pseudomonas marginalis]CAI2797838.1 Putative iron(III) dicitrate sensor protein [Pseudomonas fluorescens SBW25]